MYAKLRNGKQKTGVGLQGWGRVGGFTQSSSQSQITNGGDKLKEKRMGRGSTREVVINTKLLLLTVPEPLHNDLGITVSGSVKFKNLYQDKASAM